MVNKTTNTNWHYLTVGVEQPTEKSSYGEKLKYLVKIVNPEFPSYDFILRLASFASCSELSPKQKEKADEFIKYFKRLGYFNEILYTCDRESHKKVYDFCKENNLKRVNIQQFIANFYAIKLNDYEWLWGFDPDGQEGIIDWKKEIIKYNKKQIKEGIDTLKTVGLKGWNKPLTKAYPEFKIKDRYIGDIIIKNEYCEE